MTLQQLTDDIKHQLENSGWFSQIGCPIDIVHTALGLNEEAGEVAGLAKKEVLRNNRKDDERWLSELGDVLWYLVATINTIALSCSNGSPPVSVTLLEP